MDRKEFDRARSSAISSRTECPLRKDYRAPSIRLPHRPFLARSDGIAQLIPVVDQVREAFHVSNSLGRESFSHQHHGSRSINGDPCFRPGKWTWPGHPRARLSNQRNEIAPADPGSGSGFR